MMKNEKNGMKNRVDATSYNDIFHTVNIPEYFSPIDLWDGKYNTNIKVKI